MQIDLGQEREARFAEIATQHGLRPDQLAKIVLTRYLENDQRFIDAVNIGLAAADRGEFLDSREVWERVEEILQQP